MPRKPRIWFPGAIYHITCRGNHQSDIFRDDADRFELLNILDETQHKFPYKLHGYCFMSNHVHLHIETIDVNIGQIMKKINMRYAMHFNYRYQFIGHLFQDRYRAELIDSDEYNLTASRYIHLNPVRANIVEKPIDYQWSSYRDYMGIRKNNLVSTSMILSYFDEDESLKARRLYREFVEEEHD